MFRSIKSVGVSWLLVTFISTTLAVTLGAIPIVLLPNDDSPFPTIFLLLISGLFIGIAQWIILRSKLL